MTSAVKSFLAERLGPDVGIGVTQPSDPEHGLLEAELRAITNAVPKRRCEFAAGRRAARAAMADIGLTPVPIPMGQKREPIWPDGIAGSITHSDTLCLAVVSRTHKSIGLDIEPATPLADELIDTICIPEELRWLETLDLEDRGLEATKIFCAKEAVYKAQFPITGKLIGFEDVRISFNGARFEAALECHHFEGEIHTVDGHILAFVLVEM